MYHDKPAPSHALIGLYVGLMLTVLGVIIRSTVMITKEHELSSMLRVALMGLIIWLICLGVCALLAWLARSAYHVEYIVSEGSVELRYGRIFHETIQVRSIISIRRVWLIPRVLGWGFGGRGCCNRMTCGLLLKTTMGRVYISPADIERFCAELGIRPAE